MSFHLRRPLISAVGKYILTERFVNNHSRAVLYNRTQSLYSLFKKSNAVYKICVRCLATDFDERFRAELSAIGFSNYEAEKKTFKLQAPEFYNFAEDVIDKWARKEEVSDVRKGLPAFWWVSDHGREVKWTFQDLVDNSNRVANMLTGPCRLVPGDKVLVVLPKLPQWWLLNIACIRAGIIMMPGSTQLMAKDIKDRIQRSSAKCVICDPATAEKVDSVIDDCPTVFTKVVVEGLRLGWFMFEDMYLYSSIIFKTVKTKSSDPMMIFFTSGTTGPPKMTEHSHASYGLGHMITARFVHDLIPTDISWVLADPGWAKAAWGLFSPWINGACIFVDHVAKFDPGRILKLLQEYPVSVFCAPATAFRYLIASNPEKYDLKSVRHYTSGGEPVNAELLEHWLDKTGGLIHEAYGQTETVVLCCSPRCIPVRLGSFGKAVPGMDVTIVDANGKEVGPNIEGEIAVRCKPDRPVGLFTKYVDNEEKTSKVFIGDFYVTGDQALMDEDGYFWFTNRKDDVINSAGYRIGPFEVETALLEHPAVLEAAVVSSPDKARGEVVKAFVVLAPDYNHFEDKNALVTELQEFVKRVTAPYKYPRKIEFVETLPRTVSGKIRRVELRNKEWNCPN